MATVMLSVPDELLRRARKRLGSKDRRGINGYLRGALEALAMEGEPLDPDTEAKLLEGLDSPLRKMTDSDWQSLLKRASRARKR
jgi:hypothetical protein